MCFVLFEFIVINRHFAWVRCLETNHTHYVNLKIEDLPSLQNFNCINTFDCVAFKKDYQVFVFYLIILSLVHLKFLHDCHSTEVHVLSISDDVCKSKFPFDFGEAETNLSVCVKLENRQRNMQQSEKKKTLWTYSCLNNVFLSFQCRIHERRNYKNASVLSAAEVSLFCPIRDQVKSVRLFDGKDTNFVTRYLIG